MTENRNNSLWVAMLSRTSQLYQCNQPEICDASRGRVSARCNFPNTLRSLAYACPGAAHGRGAQHGLSSHVCGKKSYVDSPVLVQLEMNR
jgi:hypothetical protein